MVNISSRLRELRIESGLSQQELAKIVGKSQQAVNLWEKGVNDPGLDSLVKLANFFKVSADYLLGRIDDRPAHTIFGLRLKRLRVQKELNTKTVAKRLGLEETHINTYEQGVMIPSKNIVGRLACFYNVSPDYLLGLTDDPDPLDNPNDDPTLILAREIEYLPPKERQAMEAMLDVLKHRNDKAAAKES